MQCRTGTWAEVLCTARSAQAARCTQEASVHSTTAGCCSAGQGSAVQCAPTVLQVEAMPGGMEPHVVLQQQLVGGVHDVAAVVGAAWRGEGDTGARGHGARTLGLWQLLLSPARPPWHLYRWPRCHCRLACRCLRRTAQAAPPTPAPPPPPSHPPHRPHPPTPTPNPHPNLPTTPAHL